MFCLHACLLFVCLFVHVTQHNGDPESNSVGSRQGRNNVAMGPCKELVLKGRQKDSQQLEGPKVYAKTQQIANTWLQIAKSLVNTQKAKTIDQVWVQTMEFTIFARESTGFRISGQKTKVPLFLLSLRRLSGQTGDTFP